MAGMANMVRFSLLGFAMVNRVLTNNYRVFFINLFLVCLFGSPVLADTDRPGPLDQPTELRVSLVILDVDEVNVAAQSMNANVFIEVRWFDSRLAHNNKPGEITYSLGEVWHPRLQISNQRKIWETMPNILQVLPDGEVVYRQRVWGSFTNPLNLRDFPFDQQDFTIHLVTVGYGPDEIQFVQAAGRHSGIAESLSLPDWTILKVSIGPEFYKIREDFNGVPGFAISFKANRQIGYFIFKMIIPLVLIVIMSWVVFWIDPLEGGVQISVATTAMLTLIAYRFSTDNLVPKVSYLTRMDDFILGSTLLIFATLIQVLVTSTMANKGQVETALKIDKWSRFLFAGAFMALLLKSFVI